MTVEENVNLPTSAYYISNDPIGKTNCNENNKDKGVGKFNICSKQNNVSIPASGTGLSYAEIYVSHGYDGKTDASYIIPLTTNISFPSTIINRGGELFSNSKTQSIDTNSKLTPTVLPPYTTKK